MNIFLIWNFHFDPFHEKGSHAVRSTSATLARSTDMAN